MNLIHLRYFVELAHAGSYTAAAERMHTMQPNISYAVSQLEKELGVSLVTKTGRANALTSYGKQFLGYAEGTLRTLDSGVNAIRRSVQEQTVIRLGFLRYLGTGYIPEVVTAFQRNHPDLGVEFEFETGSSATLLEGLETNRLDLVCCAPPKNFRGKHTAVSRQRFALIVPPGHPLCERGTVRLEDTLDYEYIYYVKGSGIRRVIDPYFEAIDAAPQVKYELQEERVVGGFVSAGMGIGIVPHETLSSRIHVEELELSGGGMGREIHLMMTRSRDVSPLLEEFYRYMAAHPDDAGGGV